MFSVTQNPQPVIILILHSCDAGKDFWQFLLIPPAFSVTSCKAGKISSYLSSPVNAFSIFLPTICHHWSMNFILLLHVRRVVYLAISAGKFRVHVRSRGRRGCRHRSRYRCRCRSRRRSRRRSGRRGRGRRRRRFWS